MVSINTLHVFTVVFFIMVFSPVTNSFGNIILPLKGNVYPDGNYLVTFNIGNPPKPYDFDIDTGSIVTWIECDAPCNRCNFPIDQQYTPRNEFVPCGRSEICTSIPSGPCPNPDGPCNYQDRYADGFSTNGLLHHDIFTLKLTTRTVITPDLVFGCGYDQSPPPQNSLPTLGILGLGKSKATIPSQLNELGMVRNVFAHCLGRQDGFFVIGDGVITQIPGLSWVPMLEDGVYYSLGPVEVFYMGMRIGVMPSVTFDSGTTFTYFNRQTYQAVLDMINNDLVGKPIMNAPEDRTLPVCWKGTGGNRFQSVDQAKVLFKSLALVFRQAGNVQFKITPEAYLIVNDLGNVCLGILQAPQNLKNIIGDLAMQNKIIIYDNGRRSIAWTPAKCQITPPEPFS